VNNEVDRLIGSPSATPSAKSGASVAKLDGLLVGWFVVVFSYAFGFVL